MNLSTLIVLVVLAIIVGFVIRKLIRDKKSGVHHCGGDCKCCGGCGGTAPKDK